MYGDTYGIKDITTEAIAKWDELFELHKHNWDDTQTAYRWWCEDENAYYYARPRESFFEWEAYELAHKAGCTKLILEDMS